MATKALMVQNDIQTALEKNSLFKNIDFSSLNFNEIKLNFINLKEGDILFQQDDQAHSVYLILEGEINLIKKRSFGKTHTVVTRNSFVGHDELLMQTKRNSLAVALKDSHIAVLFEDDLYSLLSRNNNIYKNIKNSLTELIPDALQKFEKKIEKYKTNDNEIISPVIPLSEKVSEEKIDTIRPRKIESDNNNYRKSEAEINEAIISLNSKIVELEKEREKIQTVISSYIETTHKELNEVDRLKESEKLLTKYDKEKNEILGKQSYRIIELEKAEAEFKEIEAKLNKEIEDLTEQSKQYKTELQKLTEQEVLYKDKEKEQLGLIDGLKKKLTKVENECEDLKKTLKDHELLIDNQKHALETFKQKDVEFKKADSEKIKVINEKEKQIKQLSGKISELEKEYETHIKVINEFDQLKSKILQENKNYQNLHEEQKNKIKELEERIKDLSEELKKKEIELKDFNEELIKKDLFIVEQSDEIKQLTTELEKIRNESEDVQKLTSEISELKSRLSDSIKAKVENDSKISEQSKKLKEFEESSRNLQNQLFEKEEINNKNVQEIQDLKKIENHLSTQLNNLNYNLEVLSKEVEEKNEQIEQKENEISEVNSRLIETRLSLDEYKSIIETKSSKITELEKEIDSLRNNYKNLEETVKEKDNSIENSDEIKKTIEEINKEKEKILTAVGEKNKIVEDQTRQIENLRAAKAEILKLFESANKTNQESLRKKDEQIAALRKNLEEIKKDIEEKNYDTEHQASVIENQVNKIADLEVELSELKGKNNNNGKELSDPEKQIFNEEKKKSQEIIEEIDLIEEVQSPINNDNEGLRMEVVDADNIEEVKSSVLPEKGKAKNEEDIYAKSIHIKTEKVNSLAEDGGFIHLKYFDVSIVNLKMSRATMEYAATFSKFVKNILDQNETKLVVNLSECEYIDSSILGVLVNSLKRATSLEGDLRIVWIDTSEFSMFHVTRMDKIFQIFDNLTDAVNSYF